MLIRLITLVFIVGLVPGLTAAEYYKYRDENGVVRFTDNLLDVPKDQRKGVQAYNEIKSSDPAEEAVEGESQKETSFEDREKQAQALRDEHAQLNEIFQQLEEERKVIAEQNQNPKDQAEYEAFKKRVDAYNARIQAYERQRDDFQKRVDAFNAELGQQ